ncbi:Fc receptor-like protein 2 isoform X2 [Aquila chrysaetos chrysaetos]|uniref:Fc receptor-like protein 2 isoform X2 n=1 Tax=Aquila chrysaetos chrysaetos TaxID=223781 RepID=UPI001B7D2B0C|nr:Fc receptor-like protein 2 isoform X2 [Aquila chrysaetos chrysaetos]
MARSVALLLWGAQPSQLTLDPPWTPVFLPDKVTLTCQGSSAPGPTDWYVNEQFWQQARSNHIHITRDLPGSYRLQCRSPGAGLSPSITLGFSNDWLALQVPARVLLEGDTLPLRCRGWKDMHIAQVRFFHEREALGGPPRGTELLLPSLQLHHSGRYHCQATVGHVFPQWQESALVMVAVQGEHPLPDTHLAGCSPPSPVGSGSPLPPGSLPELFTVPVLRLEGPAEPREGTPVSLGCLSHLSPLRPLTRLQHLFYQDDMVVGGPQGSPQLQLPAVGLSHSGNYSCEVRTETASVRKRSTPVTVTVRRVPVSGVSLVAQPPGGQVVEGDRLVLSCSVAEGTGPLSFSWHRQGSAVPLATGPYYTLRTVRHQDSGRYHCTATNGGTVADSPPLWVTVLVPVAGATITMARMEPVVPAGENLNLSCSVRVGTAPVTFTWLRDGQELDSGPVLSLGTVGPAHAGTYQCLATNRLGTHRIFRARSLALALSVTQPRQGGRQQGTAMAVGLSVSLLLLLTAAMGWYLRRRCRAAAGKSWSRDTMVPQEPEGRQPEPTAHPGEPEDGEVLYTRVVVTERDGGEYGGWGTRRPRVSPPPARVPEPVSLPGTSPSRSPRGSPRFAPPREPPVTYAVLPGAHARLRLPSDTYENIP